MNEIVMFLLQGAFALVLMLFGFVLRGVRESVHQLSRDLKGLNDSVLGKYVTRGEQDSKWKDQRVIDHELRDLIQTVRVQLAEQKLKV